MPAIPPLTDAPRAPGRLQMAKRSLRARWWRRHVGYPLEAALLLPLYGLFALLPLDAASWLGGWLGRLCGPWLAGHRRAVRNLERVAPEWDAATRQRILTGMWDNIGRTLGEYPHLGTLLRAHRITVEGEAAVQALAAGGGPALMVSAHLGNWEVLPAAASAYGLSIASVYRPPNNPWADRLLARVRPGIRIAKGSAHAGRDILAHLRKGGVVGMLIDQKLNQGISVPLLGLPAMTTPAPALFARRLGCPLIPVRVERLQGARFRVTVLPPLVLPPDLDGEALAAAVMADLNGLLANWIRARPEQWLWLHRRWPEQEPARQPAHSPPDEGAAPRQT